MWKFLLIPLFLQGYSLKDAFLAQKDNHYVVYQQKKNCSFYRTSYTSPYLIVEEIHLPSRKQPTSWDAWIKQGAPHATGWFIYQINTTTNALEKGYCNKKHCSLSIDANTVFLTQLLSEPCKRASSSRYAIKFLEGRMELEAKDQKSLPKLYVYKKKTQALRKWILIHEGSTEDRLTVPPHW